MCPRLWFSVSDLLLQWLNVISKCDCSPEVVKRSSERRFNVNESWYGSSQPVSVQFMKLLSYLERNSDAVIDLHTWPHLYTLETRASQYCRTYAMSGTIWCWLSAIRPNKFCSRLCWDSLKHNSQYDCRLQPWNSGLNLCYFVMSADGNF